MNEDATDIQLKILSGQVAALASQLAANTAMTIRLDERVNNALTKFDEIKKEGCKAPGKCLDLENTLQDFAQQVTETHKELASQIKILDDDRQQRIGADKKVTKLVAALSGVCTLLGALTALQGVKLFGNGGVQKVNQTKAPVSSPLVP